MSELRRRGPARAPRQPEAEADRSISGASTRTARDALGFCRQLVSFADLATEVGESLGISPDRLARAEALERLEITTRLSIAGLRRWNTAQVKRWFTVFGDDLEIDLLLAGLDVEYSPPECLLRAGHDPQRTLEQFMEAVEDLQTSQGNELDMEARLSIAKTRALASVRGLLSTRPDFPGSAELQSATTLVFFYGARSLTKLLQFGALPEWERRGLVELGGRTVIVVGDTSGYLAGMALEIIGAQQEREPEWLTFSRPAWRQFLERAEDVRRLQAEESNWPSSPRVLTPAHLHLVELAASLEDLAAPIEKMCAALAACYLASTVSGDPGATLTLRFAGTRPPFCRLAQEVVDPASSTTPRTNGAVWRLMAWAYHHASADKLAIARECLAHELPPGVEVSLINLDEVASGALEAAKANLILYLRGNSTQYFQLRQQALELVTRYAADVRKTVSDLTGDVVDNVYRTIGLLLGVVIAVLIQPRLALTVQQIAVSIYIAYLLFLVYFLLGSRRRRFELESSDLVTHLQAMPELSERERSLLQGEAHRANQYFEDYFRWSRGLYLALAAAGAIYLLLLLTPLAVHLPLMPPSGGS